MSSRCSPGSGSPLCARIPPRCGLYLQAFHPVWGQLFKTGYQSSRYAHQVERYACLYTSHAANMLFYSPLKSYKGRLDSMTHEEAVPPADVAPAAGA